MSTDSTTGWKGSFRALNWTQLLGAFNDNLFKQAIALIAAGNASHHFLGEGAFSGYGMNPEALVGAAFSIPFVLFGAFAGALADRRSKAWLMRLLKWTELSLMLLGALLFWIGEPLGILVMVFLMGTQSAFFGPNKYGSMPEILPESELSRGNAVIQMTTYVAIITGVVASGYVLKALEVLEAYEQLWALGGACALISLIGVLTSRHIRTPPAADPERHLPLNPASSLVRDLKHAWEDRELFYALMLGSLFLLVGAQVLLAALSYAKDVLGLGVDQTSVLLGLLTIGIGLGALLCGKMSGPRIEPGLVPIGAFAVALFLSLLALPGIGVWTARALFLLAGAGAGFFVVPVRAIIQFRPADTEKGRILGLAQVIDFVAVLLASGTHHAFMEWFGMDPQQLMLAIGSLEGLLAAAVFAVSGLYFRNVPRALGLKREPGDSR